MFDLSSKTQTEAGLYSEHILTGAKVILVNTKYNFFLNAPGNFPSRPFNMWSLVII